MHIFYMSCIDKHIICRYLNTCKHAYLFIYSYLNLIFSDERSDIPYFGGDNFKVWVEKIIFIWGVKTLSMLFIKMSRLPKRPVVH